MNQLVSLAGGAVPSVFQSATNLPDMAAAAAAGLAPSFTVIGYKGRNWRIKHRGEEELVKDGQGVPIPTLPVVIVGISPAISKQFYEKRYSDGDAETPDCFSTDGLVPDAGAAKPQCASCAACQHQVFGSRITEAGKKAKACQDYRRIAVVPLGDIENEGYGGPMLLRIPPMSLGNLDKYTRDLMRYGAQPFMVGTNLGFDYDVAYPQITFTTSGFVQPAEAAQIIEQLNNPLIARMFNEDDTRASAPATPAQDDVGAALAGGPPAAFAPAPVQPAAPVAPPAPVQQAAPPPPAPVQAAAPPIPTKGFGSPPPAPPKKPSGFGAAPQPAPAQAAPAPVQAQAPAPVAPVAPVVAAAPDDLESAIDALLGS